MRGKLTMNKLNTSYSIFGHKNTLLFVAQHLNRRIDVSENMTWLLTCKVIVLANVYRKEVLSSLSDMFSHLAIHALASLIHTIYGRLKCIAL